MQSNQISTGRQLMAVIAVAIPAGVICAGGTDTLYEVSDALAREVEDRECQVGGFGELVGDDGLGVEGIRVVTAPGP